MNTTPVTQYPYTVLSAVYPYDKFVSFNPYFQQYDNGYYMIKHDVFRGVNDLSFNKYTGFYVTDKFKQKEVLKTSVIDLDETYSNAKFTMFMYATLTFVSVGADGFLYADKFQSQDASIINIVTDPDDGTVSFYYNETFVLASEPTSPWRLYLYNIQSPPLPDEAYKFKIAKFNGNYLIYTSYGSTGVATRYLKSSKNEGFIGFFGTSLGDAGIQVGVNFLDYTFIPKTLLGGMEEKSWFYSYFNRPINFQNNINVDPNPANSVSGVEQNFLLSIPYETKISDATLPVSLGGLVKVSTMDLDMVGLKNVKNPNYQYSKLPYNKENTYDFSEVDTTDYETEVNKRNYTKIYTGTNQEYGYEMPILSYSANNKSLTLLKDNTTYFHYPTAAPVVKLMESGLKEAGAFPSLIPFYSDKVFKKDAGYGKHVHWGDSTQFKNGQWLCSWLSGNNEESVWMDRWYNPQLISTFDALTAEYPEEIVCGSTKADQGGYRVMDVPTILTFEPEVWYKYFHVGEDFIKYAVDEIIDYGDQYMKLHYNNWQVSSISDATANHNNGTFMNFDPLVVSNQLNDTEDNVAVLNGADQYVFIPYSETLKPSGSNSFCIWAYSENWETVRSSEIVSNGIGNYYNLKITNGLENPISVLYAKDTKKLLLFNNEGKIYSVVNMPSGVQTPTITDACIDSNLNVWVFDSANGVLYKINYNGLIDLKIVFPTTMSFSNMTMDSQNSVYLDDTNTGSLSAITPNGDLSVFATDLTGANLSIDCDQFDQVVGHIGTKLSLDNKDYPWVLSVDRTELLRYTTAMFKAETYIDDFVIDSNSFIWVLYDGNKLAKLDSVGNIMRSVVVPITNLNAALGCITIVNDYYSRTNSDEDFVVVSKNNHFYKYDSNLRYIGKVSTAVVPYEKNYNGFLTDWSGYNFKRKFVYNQDFENVSNLELAFNLATQNGDVSEYKLYIPVTRLYKGWHHFTGVFNREDSRVYFYVDGELEDRVTSVTPNSQMHKNLKNSMLLGSKMGTINNFNHELSLVNKYQFEGKLDDFRIYSKALTQLDVEMLYKTKQSFFDINWHIPTGLQYYAEEIQRFFKHKMPGSKSNHYNINLVGLGITDAGLKSQIETIIRDTVTKIAPAYTQLYRINWIEELPSGELESTNSAFEFTIDVTQLDITAGGNTLAIKFENPQRIWIDWGDGSCPEQAVHGSNANTYPTVGNRVVKIFGAAGTCDTFSMSANQGMITSLDTPIPNWELIGAGSMFEGCYRMGSIPERLFANNTNIQDFLFTFKNCLNLLQLPDDLFGDNIVVTVFDKTFEYCHHLKSIPVTLFAKTTEVDKFVNTFSYCLDVPEIPEDLFINNRKAVAFIGTFIRMDSLTAVPAGLFRNNVSATNFDSVFSNCENLKTVPVQFFINNPLVTRLRGAFQSCNDFETIPSDFFDYTPFVTTVGGCFLGTKITTIPDGLLDNCPNIDHIASMFWNCDSLTAIPVGLFDNCPLIDDAAGVFASCKALSSIPAGIFAYSPSITRLEYAFDGCTSLTGLAPTFWISHPTTDGTYCFRSCTGLTNYAAIPATWK